MSNVRLQMSKPVKSRRKNPNPKPRAVKTSKPALKKETSQPINPTSTTLISPSSADSTGNADSDLINVSAKSTAPSKAPSKKAPVVKKSLGRFAPQKKSNTDSPSSAAPTEAQRLFSLADLRELRSIMSPASDSYKPPAEKLPSKPVKKTITKKVAFKAKKGKVQFDASAPAPGSVQSGQVHMEPQLTQPAESHESGYLYAFE